MKRTIEVVTLSLERRSRMKQENVLTVELGRWNGEWVVLAVIDEYGKPVELSRTETHQLQARAESGEDEAAEDTEEDELPVR